MTERSSGVSPSGKFNKVSLILDALEVASYEGSSVKR